MRFAIALILVAACTDASDDSETAAQQNAGSVCTGDLYDGCTSDDQCSSGTCKLYSNRGVQVCTQTCDAANPCPSQDGKAVVCNNKGICRPDAPTACQVE